MKDKDSVNSSVSLHVFYKQAFPKVEFETAKTEIKNKVDH